MSRLAVVVPTRDRAQRLRALVASLEGEDVELLVVDDGSEDETAEVLRSAGAAHLRLDPARGPAAARNLGWRSTSAPLVAFVDDDCVVQPGWSAALAAVAADRDDVVVVGRTDPDPREAHLMGAFARTLSVQQAGPYFQTCNIAYPRALLERLGGFDEGYGRPVGEDTDLGHRALAAGASALFAADAVVHHAVHDLGPIGLVRDSQRWADAVRLLQRHPQLRETLWLGVFWKRSHAPLLAAVAAAALRRPAPAALALAAWAATHRGSHGSVPGLLAALPAHLAVDAAELVAMLRGSLEHGALVL